MSHSMKKIEFINNKSRLKLTRSVVNGANTAPILPVIEHEFMIVVRKFVGHNSAVKMYKTLNAKVIDDFPIMNSPKTIIDCSFGTHGAVIDANPVNVNEQNSNFFRPNRLSKSAGNNAPGISTACTMI